MRWGVLADVHGNLPALDAVITRLEAESVDGFVCAGDLVGYGPFPNECVERVGNLPGIVCVAGNHDLIALGLLSDDRCIALARDTLRWTAGVLTSDARAWLEALPLRAATPTKAVAVAHGSWNDPQEYVRTEEQALEQLGELSGRDEQMLVLGHTHEPLLVGSRTETMPAASTPLHGREKWLLNPGSVGQSRSRDLRARCLVIDEAQRNADFLAVEYDVEATRSALRDRGLPPDACHLPPKPLARRIAGRAARAVLRR